MLFKLLISLILLSLVITACKKLAPVPIVNGRTGVLDREIFYTCNGCITNQYDIKFTTDTSTFYAVSNDLTPFGITASTKCPLNVTVTSKPDTSAGSNFITITALQVNK